MILRALSSIAVIATLTGPAAAQERVTVGTLRQASNGALFIAAAHGYFKAEGLDVEMTAYPAAQPVVEALAAGASDFGLADFSPAAFDLAGLGKIKAIAAQVREKRDYEGNQIVASNAAYAKGLRKPEDLAGKSFAISALGSSFHYQLGQIARIKRFDFASVTLKPMQSLDATAHAVATAEVDAAILPAHYARELLTANQAKLVGWYSELDEQQLGALFASAKVIETRRATAEKFLRAYARGAATVEAGVYFMDPQARLDTADIARQVEWYKSQGLVAPSVEARAVVDLSFIN